MNRSEINSIISKFIDKEATSSEQAFLMEWIKDGDNLAYFENFVNTDIWIKYNFDSGLVEEQLATLSISASPRKRKNEKIAFAYAGCAALLMAIGLFIYVFITPSYISVLDVNAISLEVNGSDTRYYSLENNTHFTLRDASIQLLENELLTYKRPIEADMALESEIYHTLHVPFGKTFKVHFSDGSHATLNAGSRLSYPKYFDAHDTRQVSLVGEAYFKIAKSSKPFLVRTGELSTRVLGTEFNVSAYANDTKKEIVLVEGFVELLQNRQQYTSSDKLIPNQKATKTDRNKVLFIENVDVKNHIAWLDGGLVFESETIADISKKLERRFNVKIENTYEKLEELRFNGRFQNEQLDEILNTMKAHTDFSYELVGTILKIDKPK